METRRHAEDIAAHVDQFVTILHDSVGWGGFAVFSGPDEKGEVRIHVYVAAYLLRSSLALIMCQHGRWDQPSRPDVLRRFPSGCRLDPVRV